MEVFLTPAWFLAGATAGWWLTSLRLARTASLGREQMRTQMRTEIGHWQSQTDHYKAAADRHARDTAARAAGCKQGRDDVITIMPMLLTAQQLLGQDRDTHTAEMNDCA